MSPIARTVARPGFDLHYRVYGTGAPFVILAGGPGFDCDYMEPVATELAKTHQAILVELRGTGRSLPPAINSETINARETIADLEAIREQMKIESWTLAGHSAGGLVAMTYAISYPERLAGLVLMNSAPIRYASAGAEMENVMMRLTPDERAALENTAHSDFGRMLEIILPGYFFDRSQAPLAAPHLRPENYHAEAGRLLGSDILPPGADLRPALKGFARPVLVIAGRQDPLDPAIQNEIHLTFKNSTLHLIERCGHFSWIEQPDEFYRSVREFLAAENAAREPSTRQWLFLSLLKLATK